eukprot:Phypoly_transcript_16080.p1 GENE.Phypoly_transcript_16080~~Phypoly_transcript_16080.p1  ORF type:complete len:280 (+),score=27.81 Phypoly_transcript_16080:19-858(+)
MDTVKHIIIVLSGKGGVGKSTVSVSIARSLVKAGKKVGLLDIDLCGPSIPKLVGLEGKSIHQSTQGWVPVFADNQQNLAVLSIQFLLDQPDAPVIWRGPKKTSMINQFVNNVYWGELDYLVIDTPPGTSDEHIAVMEFLQKHNPDGAVIVTTPQGVSITDVRKEISFCRSAKIPILGVFENMSGFVCPHCSECTNIFSSEGGRLLAEETNVPFLGKLPIDPQLTQACEKGQNFVEMYPDSQALIAIHQFVKDTIASHSQTSQPPQPAQQSSSQAMEVEK